VSALNQSLPSTSRVRSWWRAPIGVHVRVLLHRTRLDNALLDGADPASSPELGLRARQLTATRHRRVLADSLDEVMRIAEGPKAPRLAASAPLVRADVRAARGALLDLGRSLQREGEVNPAGVILAERLLTDGSGPLYMKAENDALWHAAHEANAALDRRTRSVGCTGARQL
jgi:hypothetical protein